MNHRRRWCLVVLSVVSWVFSVVAISHCSLFEAYNYNNESTSRYFGLFNFKHEDSTTGASECRRYSGTKGEELEDGFEGASIKVARAFGVITAILTSAALLCVILVVQLNLQTRKKAVWKAVRILFICAAVTQPLLFCALDYEGCSGKDAGKCYPGLAGVLASFNCAFLFVLSILSCYVPAPGTSLPSAPDPPILSDKRRVRRR
jgi:hypothetical protein